MMGGIRVDVMSCRDADARAEYPNGLVLVGSSESTVTGPFDPDDRSPAVVIVRKRFSFGETLQAVLVEGVETGGYRDLRREGVGPMFGGRFIWTSDSRFASALGTRADSRPVKLMDRWETREEYATYD